MYPLDKMEVPKSVPWQVRKITRSGHSRHLNISGTLPLDWYAVKVEVVSIKDGVCMLRLEQIK